MQIKTIDIRNIYDRYTLYIHYVTIMVEVWLTNPTFHSQILYYPQKIITYSLNYRKFDRTDLNF